MRRRTILIAFLLTVGAFAACGGADGGSAGIDLADDVSSDTSDDPFDVGADEIAENDFFSRITFATTGLTPDVLGVSDDDIACVNERLRDAFPDGLPENIPASPDVLQELNDATLGCEITFDS
jgi:hypothetical protein